MSATTTPGRRHFAFLAAAPSATGIAHTLPVADPFTLTLTRSHGVQIVPATDPRQMETGATFPEEQK